GPYRPDEATGITSDQLSVLLKTLRGMYATVVVDGGSTMDGRAMSVLNSADRLALVVTPDIPALRLLHSALEVFSEMGNAADRTTFVFNDIYPKSSISADQIEEHLSIKVRSEEHTSELQSQSNLVCRLLLEKKNINHKRGAHFRKLRST